MFVSGNNLSAAVGTLVGSRIISRAGGILIGAAGFSAGFLLQGRYMNSVALTLLPHSTYLVTILFSIVIVIFLVAQILKSPLSLSMALVGTAVGISLRIGSGINTGYLELLLVQLESPEIQVSQVRKDYRGYWGDDPYTLENLSRASLTDILSISMNMLTPFSLQVAIDPSHHRTGTL